MAGTWNPPDDPAASDTAGADDTSASEQHSDVDSGEDAEAARPPAPGDLVVTEIMDDPDPTDDDAGEWFELRNVSDARIALGGLTLRDAEDEQLRFDTDLIVEPDGIVVLAASDDTSDNGGIVPDLMFDTSVFHLGNTSDEIVVLYGTETIDEVAYDDRFPHEKGRSRALDPLGTSATRNDEPGYWCEGAHDYGTDGNRGTPGLPNDPC
jgi:hypothetical protein